LKAIIRLLQKPKNPLRLRVRILFKILTLDPALVCWVRLGSSTLHVLWLWNTSKGRPQQACSENNLEV